jgi:outer membrane lipoprotein-sorting protein
MGLLARHPRARWAAPAAAAALVAGGAFVASSSAQAADHPSLPTVSAQQLLVDLQTPTTKALEGTVTYDAHLGLPSLPTGVVGGESGAGGPQSGASGDVATSLLSGSHTLRVWSDGPRRSRVAVVDGTSESDLIRNGSDVWTWSSVGQEATHTTLPAHSARPAQSSSLAAELPATPQKAAQQALAAIGPSTAVSTDSTAKVAGRPAYELVLEPRDAGTLVDRVVVAVDASTHVPLRVDVYSTKRTAPALEVGFSKVSFTTPDASHFTFTPPRGVSVKQVTLPSSATATKDRPAAQRPKTSIVGEGWDQVAVVQLTPAQQEALLGDASSSDQAAALLGSLPTVSGSWGSGHVIAGTLFSAVLTSDGRVAVGAVPVSALGSALAQG